MGKGVTWRWKAVESMGAHKERSKRELTCNQGQWTSPLHPCVAKARIQSQGREAPSPHPFPVTDWAGLVERLRRMRHRQMPMPS